MVNILIIFKKYTQLTEIQHYNLLNQKDVNLSQHITALYSICFLD
jgi:hypothetical protein